MPGPPARYLIPAEWRDRETFLILRGVNSTRVWIKQENARCERFLLELAEADLPGHLDDLGDGLGRQRLRVRPSELDPGG